MALEGKRLDDVTQVDLQALIDNAVREAKGIEYKVQLPSNGDEDKKKFLADVSSFANATGGDLLFGISAKAGVPVALPGLSIQADDEILRLENMVRDGLDPRIGGIAMRPIRLDTGAEVLAIRIPKSWASPHMVTFKGHSRFYSRNSAGKYQLDVREIRTAFGLSDAAGKQVRDFRADRLAQIVAGATPVRMHEGAKIVLHIVPFSAFDAGRSADLLTLDQVKLRPMNSSGWNHRHNFDGFVTFSGERTYLQIFRNGSIEAVEASILAPWDGYQMISSAYERQILDSVPRFFAIQQGLGADPPLFLMLSLVGVRGYQMEVSSRFFSIDHNPVDKDMLILPEVLAETFDIDAQSLMRPIFDMVWNAAGWPRSMNYDEQGDWVGQQA